MRVTTDCIACGCCVSSCTMVHHHPDYVGPAARSRAYSLIADDRDGLCAERLAASIPSCHECRTEMNCTEVCPKGISPTYAIKYIQRAALTHANKPIDIQPGAGNDFTTEKIDRATFLRQAGVFAIGTAVALTIGGIATHRGNRAIEADRTATELDSTGETLVNFPRARSRPS